MTTPRHLLACGALLLSLAAPAAAHAQLGGLMKKAKNAAAGAATRAAGDAAVEKVAGGSAAASGGGSSYGALPGEPIDAPTFAALVRGLRRTEAMFADADSARARTGRINEQINAIEAKHPGAAESYDEAVRGIERCQNTRINAAENARQAVISKKMDNVRNDPAAMRQVQSYMMKYQAEISAAQQRGDPEALEKVMSKMHQEITGIDLIAAAKADTADARKACGTPPAKPAHLVEIDNLRAQYEKLNAEVRSKEEQAGAAGAVASGLPADRYHLLRERLELMMRRGKQASGATDDEVALVKQYEAENKALQRAL
jgi:hypothetical protein